MPIYQFYKRRPSPWPWQLTYQLAPTGWRKTRFEIKDAEGKKIRLSRPANGVLVKLAPEMFDLLTRMLDRLRYFHFILTTEMTHKVEAPELAVCQGLLEGILEEIRRL